MEHGRDDAYLLLVARREVADELLLSHHLAIHEAVEAGEALVNLLLAQAIHLADEGEVLLGSEVVDEEAIVDEGARVLLPVLCLADIHAAVLHDSAVGLDEVENQSEEGGLSCTVVAHEANHIAVGYLVMFHVDGSLFAEVLL